MREAQRQQYNGEVLLNFEMSKRYQRHDFVMITLGNNKKIKVHLYRDLQSRTPENNLVAVFPVLEQSELAEAFQLLSSSNTNIYKFFMSSDCAPNNSDPNNEKHIHFITIDKISQTVTINVNKGCNGFNTIYHSDDDTLTAYQALANHAIGSSAGVEIKRFKQSDASAHYQTPLFAACGGLLKLASNINDDEIKAFCNAILSGKLLTEAQLSQLRAFYAKNNDKTQLNSILGLSPGKTYFYISAFLSTVDISGLRRERLHDDNIYFLADPITDLDQATEKEKACLDQENIKGVLRCPADLWDSGAYLDDECTKIAIPEVGRGFYDPTLKLKIVVVNPEFSRSTEKYNEIIRRLREKNDIVIVPNPECVDYAQEIITQLQNAGYCITNLGDLVCTLFEASPTYNSTSTSTHESPQRAARGGRTAASPYSGRTPGSIATQSRSRKNKSREYYYKTTKRLTVDDYQNAVYGLLQINGLRLQYLNNDSNNGIIDHVAKDNLTIYVKTSMGLAEAKNDLCGNMDEENSQRIYIINNGNDQPLTILYHSHTGTFLLYLRCETKQAKAMQFTADDLAITSNGANAATIQPIAIQAEETKTYADEQALFHQLHRMLNSNEVCRESTPVDESTAEVKSYINFNTLKAMPHPGRTVHHILIKPIPDIDRQTPCVKAYIDTVKACFMVGMTLIKRIQDDKFNDLGFLFKRLGQPDQYFLICHPVDNLYLSERTLNRYILGYVNGPDKPAGISAEDVVQLHYQDEPQVYPYQELADEDDKLIPVGAGKKYTTFNYNGRRIEEADESPILFLHQVAKLRESSAYYHFRQEILYYLNKGYEAKLYNITKDTIEFTGAILLTKDDHPPVILATPTHKSSLATAKTIQKLVRAIQNNNQDSLGNKPQAVILQDDLDTPRQAVIVKQQLANLPFEDTYLRQASHSNEQTKEYFINSSLLHIGLASKNRERSDKRPAFTYTPQKAINQPKTNWGFVKRHWKKILGLSIFVVASIALAVPTFGFSLIPLPIAGACFIGVSAACGVFAFHDSDDQMSIDRKQLKVAKKIDRYNSRFSTTNQDDRLPALPVGENHTLHNSNSGAGPTATDGNPAAAIVPSAAAALAAAAANRNNGLKPSGSTEDMQRILGGGEAEAPAAAPPAAAGNGELATALNTGPVARKVTVHSTATMDGLEQINWGEPINGADTEGANDRYSLGSAIGPRAGKP